MNKFLYILFIVLTVSSNILSQNKAADYLLKAEMNPKIVQVAVTEAAKLNQPKSIYLPQGIFIDLVGIEDGKPVYVVMYNLANPFDDCEVMDYEQIKNNFDLNTARLHYTDGSVVNETLGMPEPSSKRLTRFLMFVESTNDRVSTLDPITGDVINLNYLSGGGLNLPQQARLTPWGFISLSDQNADFVNRYDTLGVYTSIFAPAGGVNTAILDNVRGHNYLNGKLLVSVASSANANSIVRFDSAGNFVDYFIAPSGGGLNSPYDILIRSNDVLISASGTDNVIRYDLSGNFLNVFCTRTNFFPQQMYEMTDGNILLADFGVGGGLRIYSPTGDSIALFSVLTALRGAYKLGNGNYLVTNAAGLHELSSTGSVVRTIISGVAGRFINEYDLGVIPVELTSFNAVLNNSYVDLKWSTATELNNQGFEIEKSINNISYTKIGFVNGAGNSTDINNYSFRDKELGSGKIYYRLKQLDFNGAFNYSNVEIVENSSPQQFSLEQNYPNPFNPVTKIKFSIPSDHFITLEVFNVLGQKVSSVFSGNIQAGSHTMSFNSSELNSGVYYYKLTAGNNSSVKKMIIMK
ncbi:MAG TPA: T9SS type A sorting domain-containing protein [Ignavibacteriaceae bacterium]|nr:T9SS type A sorting domain-containing protein [Ignavibacteriaceae bacterium]